MKTFQTLYNYLVTLSLFDPEWKFGKTLTEDIDTKKNKPVVTDAAYLQ